MAGGIGARASICVLRRVRHRRHFDLGRAVSSYAGRWPWVAPAGSRPHRGRGVAACPIQAGNAFSAPNTRMLWRSSVTNGATPSPPNPPLEGEGSVSGLAGRFAPASNMRRRTASSEQLAQGRTQARFSARRDSPPLQGEGWVGMVRARTSRRARFSARSRARLAPHPAHAPTSQANTTQHPLCVSGI